MIPLRAARKPRASEPTRPSRTAQRPWTTTGGCKAARSARPAVRRGARLRPFGPWEHAALAGSSAAQDPPQVPFAQVHIPSFACAAGFVCPPDPLSAPAALPESWVPNWRRRPRSQKGAYPAALPESWVTGAEDHAARRAHARPRCPNHGPVTDAEEHAARRAHALSRTGRDRLC
jgi:hypothetical protein